MLSHLAKHLTMNNILINVQRGLRNRHSAVTLLMSSSMDCLSIRNNIGQTDVILQDLSKAFNKI